MATTIRPEVSMRNKYWIEKHRHYELKHFCLQYPEWKKTLNDICNSSSSLSNIGQIGSSNLPGDPTGNIAIEKIYYSAKIELIERVAKETDSYLWNYILKAVTEGLSYNYLKYTLGIPCSRGVYYDRYRRFFWLLNEERG